MYSGFSSISTTLTKMGEYAAIFFIFLVAFYQTSIALATDESSLLILKARISADPNNILSTNWTQGTSFCTWTGVNCSTTSPPRVTGLDLFNSGLEGIIPRELGNLSFLTHLNIANNSFTGPIPHEIGNLTRLRALIMSNNQLGGNIPASLGSLTKLEKLNLANNRLIGSVPASLFNLPSLQVISVTRNYGLTGALPEDMCSNPSTKLEQLLFSMSQLVGSIPENLSRCRQLKIIVLSKNNFTGRIPATIGSLSQLQILGLGGNQLSGPIPPSMGNLSNLHQLDLSYNTIQGTVPLQMGQLSNLTFLNLGMNNLTGILPPSIFNLTRLQTLSLTGNNFSGTLPPSIDEGLPSLRLLYLGANQFTGNIPNSISNISGLNTLDVYFNSFSGHIPTTLGNLQQLQVLRLGENKFINNLSVLGQDFLTPLTNCKNLTIINISLNPITGALPRSVGSSNFSASLENFVAFSCRFQGTIPNEIGNLISLVYLTLGDNELAGVVPSSLGRLKNLQRLSIYGNRLQGSFPQSFCSMENMYYLSLDNTGLSGELPACLGNLTSLREVYLGDNRFSSNIPSTLWSIQRLQVLSLYNNSFDGSLPDQEISNLRSVTELYLHGNQLSGGIPSSIGRLENLLNLSLSDNKLEGSIPESFADLKFLQHLDLSNNNLSGPIPKSLENLSDLDYFNVSFNQLSGEIPDKGHFGNFTPELFEGNKGLCGAPRFKVEACKRSATKSSTKSKLIRYILPPIASIIVVTTIVVFLLRHCGRKSSTPSKLADFGLMHERISYYDILRATSNLNVENLIGKGSIGSVYKGTFSSETIMAVKVFNLDVQGAFKSFDTECQIMRSLRHRNLVKVITSCSNLDFKALVVEYMPNGNLDKCLHSLDYSLSVFQRLGIMIDVASAIEYLHRGYLSPIVHCDLKPNNILLDEDMVAHVGDFGIAKLLTENQMVAQTKTLGTIGYMAPEYGSSGLVSTAVDVYSYGILLMETFTRKKPTDEMFQGELTLKKWVSESVLVQIVDADLVNTDDEYSKASHEKCVESIMRVAIGCTSDLPEERPDMEDVLVRLKMINIQLHETVPRVR